MRIRELMEKDRMAIANEGDRGVLWITGNNYSNVTSLKGKSFNKER